MQKKIIDVFTFNGEYDLLEIRLNILNDYVDKFVIIEFDKTFSGIDKPSYYLGQQERFRKWEHKISYACFGEAVYEKYKSLAESSPNTAGAAHWKTEFMMKESIKDALFLLCLNDDDIVVISDCDEIWNPETLLVQDGISKLGQKMYLYYLNNRIDQKWDSSLVCRYKDIKNECLNHIRSNRDAYPLIENCGWHFSSMGGFEEVKRKLGDSYTDDSYWTEDIKENLEDNFADGKDFLGRSYDVWIDEIDLHPFILDNKEKYARYFKS